MCSDGMPIQLDWSHNGEKVKDIECSRERTSRYVFPRRLSLEDRRQRLQASETEERGWPYYWKQPASLRKSEAEQQSLFDIDSALTTDDVEDEAAENVIYCRHLKGEEQEDDEESLDGLGFLLDWRRIATLSG
jgi:hypothetical protein